MRIVSALLIALTLLMCVARGAGAPAAALHTLTPEEFAKAGLNKLTPEELVYLEEALARHQQAPNTASPTVVAAQTTAPAAPPEKVIKSTDRAASSFGAEQVSPAPKTASHEELHAHIEGTIESFSGRAVFVLDNGQIWQQRIPDTVYFTPKLVNPEVIITKGFIGYKMLIVPANRIVFVKRVQ